MVENNIDKKITSVIGETLEDAIENETPIDIEIVSEETTVSNEPLDVDQDFYDNLADKMEEDQLNRISSQLIDDYENDKASRDDWSRSYTKGLDLIRYGKSMDGVSNFYAPSEKGSSLLKLIKENIYASLHAIYEDNFLRAYGEEDVISREEDPEMNVR